MTLLDHDPVFPPTGPDDDPTPDAVIARLTGSQRETPYWHQTEPSWAPLVRDQLHDGATILEPLTGEVVKRERTELRVHPRRGVADVETHFIPAQRVVEPTTARMILGFRFRHKEVLR